MPVFVEPLSAPVECSSGERAHFHARYEPLTEAVQVAWFKDNKPLTNASRVKLLNELGYLVLEISPVIPEVSEQEKPPACDRLADRSAGVRRDGCCMHFGCRHRCRCCRCCCSCSAHLFCVAAFQDSGAYTARLTTRGGEAVSSSKLTVKPRDGIISQSQLPEAMSGAQRRIDEIEGRRRAEAEEPVIVHGPPKFVTQLQKPPQLREGANLHLEVCVQSDEATRRICFHFFRPPFNRSIQSFKVDGRRFKVKKALII